MKKKTIITGLLAAALLAFSGVCRAEEHENQTELQAKAKITKEEATKTALAKVPNGTIKECELEAEKGILIWSFDMATPGTKDTTEVNVNAMTGAIVSVEHENAAAEAKEASDEAKEKK